MIQRFFKKTKTHPTTSLPKELMTSLQALQQFLRLLAEKSKMKGTSWAKKETKKYCCLLIGPSKTGKSTLLNQANLSFIRASTISEIDIQAWHSDSTIFLKMPSNYLETNNLSVWKEIKKIFKPYNHLHRINGVFITLNLTQIVNQDNIQRQKLIENLRQALHQLSDKDKRKMKVNIIITHMDRLTGFLEYFDYLNEQKRKQQWGIELHLQDSEPEKFREHLISEFSNLLFKVNTNIIKRLQYERNLINRGKIKNFPTQMEILIKTLTELITQLFSHHPKNNNYDCCSINFCSNLQDGNNIDLLLRKITNAFSLSGQAIEETTIKTTQQRSYFTKGIFNNFPHTETTFETFPTASNKCFPSLLKLCAYCAIGFSAIISTFFLAQYFNVQMQRLNTAEGALQRYQFLMQLDDDKKTNEKQNFLALKYLSTANEALKQISHPSISFFTTQKYSDVSKRIQQIYQRTLTNQLLPIISKQLEVIIKKELNNPSSKLYGTLKVYLMLGDPKYLQPNYVSNTLKRYLKNNNDVFSDEINLLQEHLPTILLNKDIAIPLNKKLIEQARQALNKLPLSLQIYLTLKNYTDNQTINPLFDTDDNQLIFIYNDNPSSNKWGIPDIYTRKNFETIYEKNIDDIVTEVIEGDWVLGNKKSTMNDKTISKEQLLKMVRSFYLSDYVNWWNLSLYKTQPVTFKNLYQANNALQILSNEKSPLTNMLRIVFKNTQPIEGNTPTIQAFNKIVASKFTKINSVLTSSKSKNIEREIENLRNYANEILTATDINKAAFLTMKIHASSEEKKLDPINNILATAKTSPEPLKTWLEAIAKNTLSLILQHAERYINLQWKNTILREYDDKISQRYPLFKQAKTEITITNFENFFGPQGSLYNYFNTYLKPFIDINQTRWKVKTIHGLKLNIPEAVVYQFERASIIRKMFFPKKTNQLTVEFSLQPLLFEPIVKTMSLSINGQRLQDQQGSTTINYFNWPGDKDNNNVKLNFTNIDGQRTTTIKQGKWAWFRLLDYANLEAIAKTKNDPRYYDLIFDLNGSAAKYRLVAKEKINPFIPHIIDQFQVPREIVKNHS